jgi:hypothetical protein
VRLMTFSMIALLSVSTAASAETKSESVVIVTGAITASAPAGGGDLAQFVDDGTEAEQMGMNHVPLGKADFSGPAGCELPSAKMEEIRPKMVLISWFCGGKFSGVRKTALIGKHKIVALLGDVTQSGN